MRISEKRQKLQEYILVAENEKVKALYTLVEKEIEAHYNPWEDASFIAEIEKRSNDLKTGKDKGITLEEMRRKLDFKIKTLTN